MAKVTVVPLCLGCYAVKELEWYSHCLILQIPPHHFHVFANLSLQLSIILSSELGVPGFPWRWKKSLN